MHRRRHGRERGVVTVEFGLALPAVLLVVLFSLHLGRALAARHRIADAAGYASRAAAIAGDPAQVEGLLRARLAGQTDCSEVSVVAEATGDKPPRRVLQVRATCTLAQPFGSSLLGAIGPDQVSATAAMPME